MVAKVALAVRTVNSEVSGFSVTSKRRWAVLGFLCGALVLFSLASLLVGARPIAPATLWSFLRHMGQSTGFQGDEAVYHVRSIRTAVALLVGACLGLSGTAMQGVTRNPLADAGLLGISAGSAVAMAAGAVLFSPADLRMYLVFAFCGAALAALVVYGVASIGRGGATPVKLVVVGAACTAGAMSWVNILLLLKPEALTLLRNWQVGSLGGRNWEQVMTVLPIVILGGSMLLGTGRWLNALAFGEDMARGWGQNIARVRTVVFLGVVLLCGAATALAGPFAFIGLLVPHALRLLLGRDYRWLLPYAVVAAPLVLLGADLVGRLILLPGEVPAGIIAILCGAPLFLVILRKSSAVAL